MRPMDRSSVRRLGLAVALSLSVHGALLLLIQAQPGAGTSARSGVTLQARIEAQTATDQGPETKAPSQAEEAPREPAQTPAVAAPTEAASPARVTPGTARDEAATALAKAAGAVAAAPTTETGRLEMPFATDPTYYAVSALDTPPRLLGSADACYPHGATGEVAYVLLINETGKVDEVTVAAAQPTGLFTGAAAELCGQLAFVPGTRNGRPVRSRVRFVVGPTPH